MSRPIGSGAQAIAMSHVTHLMGQNTGNLVGGLGQVQESVEQVDEVLLDERRASLPSVTSAIVPM